MHREKNSHSSHSRRSERGAVAILVALSLITLFGFAALAIDMGRFRVASAELQNASDSGALAGAWELDATLTGMGLAQSTGIEFAEKHSADNADLTDVTNDDVVPGVWDFTTKMFNEGGDPEDINAVQVTTYRNDVKGTAMVPWLGTVGGFGSGQEWRTAVAVGLGPGCMNAFPVAIPECGITNEDGSLKCDGTEIKLSNDIIDNGGLTSLSEDPASVAKIKSIIEAYDPNKKCTSEVTDEIKMNNGNAKQPVGTTIREELLDPDGDGVEEPVKVYLPIIDTPCPVKYNQTHHVTGYIGFEIQHINLPNDPGGNPATDPFITGVLVCDEKPVGAAGGKWYGTKGKPRLVF